MSCHMPMNRRPSALKSGLPAPPAAARGSLRARSTTRRFRSGPARYRYLSPERSAPNPASGTTSAPCTAQPMDRLSPHHPAERVVRKPSSQSGKSECLLNFIGYVIDLDPGPILCVQPERHPAG
ncbi:MAG: phage terminase large subunit family protein [Ignavibacteriales bacterium]|nr:phage terminase large subunit family protein [Ignavibacteriales bacterium]